MQYPDTLDADWPYLLSFLPADLAQSARAAGAFQRRRGVDSAATLLRLALTYAATGGALRTVAAWADAQGLAQLSDVALLKRLRAAAPWLGQLLTELLAREVPLPTATALPLQIRLQDATTVSRPGSKGTDWRIHLGFELQSLQMDAVELTDATGGETLTRVPVRPGEVWVADRGYAHRAGLAHCVAAGGHVVVRLNWQNVPLQHPEGTPFDLLAALRALPEATCGDFPVQTAPDAAHALAPVSGRLVALRKSPAQAEASRRKLLRAARKKGKTPDPRTLEAAGYVFLFTTLPVTVLSAAAVLDLYRFRWQIELAFKRMKSLLTLDEMTAKDPALCRTFLFGKLLLYALTERLCRPRGAFPPWGYGRPASAACGHPVAPDATGVPYRAPGDCPGVDPRPVAGAPATRDAPVG